MKSLWIPAANAPSVTTAKLVPEQLMEHNGSNNHPHITFLASHTTVDANLRKEKNLPRPCVKHRLPELL